MSPTRAILATTPPTPKRWRYVRISRSDRRGDPKLIDRSVRRVLADQGIAVDEVVAGASAMRTLQAERRAPRALLATDIDAQAGNPLAVLRSLVP